jgi:hypothetical protein
MDGGSIERLDTFLARRGATREVLVTSLDEPFGRPLLLVATGSILYGFGNQGSDIDIQIIVEQPVTRLPIPSYAHRVHLDTVYFSSSDVKNWVTDIRDSPWPPAGRSNREHWKERRAQLFYCTRFSSGLRLCARDGWDDWLAELRRPWLFTAVARWWRIEALRRYLAARWLRDIKPLLAAQRYLDAVLAVTESRMAAAGQAHFGPKWLLEKLRVVGDAEGIEVLRTFFKAPASGREVDDYIVRCEAFLNEFWVQNNDDYLAQVWYLPGVTVRELGARSLVSRWNVRTLEFQGSAQSAIPAEPLWEGSFGALPPPNLLSLFQEDMTWLSIVARSR